MLRGVTTVIFSILFSSNVCAQETARQYVSDTSGLTLNEVITTALANNKNLVAARESQRQSEARLTQARLRPNPELGLSRITDALFAREGDTGLSVTISQEIELGGKRGKRIDVEQAAIEVAKADIANAERELAGRLAGIFVEAMGAASKLDLFDRLDKLNQQVTSTMASRVKAGDASRLDSQLLAAETNQVLARRLAAESQLDGTLLQIRTLMGKPLNESLLLKRETAAARVPDSENAAVERALENRPDLEAARLREHLEEAGISLAKAQAVPNVTASVRYGRESFPFITGSGGPRSFDRENVMEFGVSIPLPFSNRQQGSIAETASRRAQARAEREALEASVRQETSLAFRRYDAARRTVDVIRDGILAPNQESLRIIELAYGLGELRSLDVVNQQRVALEAETSVIEAQTELEAALATLDYVMGQSPRLRSSELDSKTVIR